jgi:diaminopimelate dehydrogenase
VPRPAHLQPYPAVTHISELPLARVAVVCVPAQDVLSVLSGAFEMLMPQGRTHFHRHPGISLHHTAAAARVPGVKDALAGQYRGEHGAPQHLVYVELPPTPCLPAKAPRYSRWRTCLS